MADAWLVPLWRCGLVLTDYVNVFKVGCWAGAHGLVRVPTERQCLSMFLFPYWNHASFAYSMAITYPRKVLYLLCALNAVSYVAFCVASASAVLALVSAVANFC